MTDFEKKLAEQLNISKQTLIDTADTVVNHLLTKPKASSRTKINGKIVRDSIDEQLNGNDRMYVMKLFKPANDYSIDEVRDGVMLGKFDSECRVSGENDLFVMIPDSKLILCVEIKRLMKSKDEKSTSVSTPSIDANMKKASVQLKKNAKFISSQHGAILSPVWKFAEVCAISPSIYNSDKICNSCKRFILTTDIVKTPGRIDEWWKETGFSSRASMFDQKSKDEAYKEFQLFFNRMVCMSSVKVVPDPFHSWAQAQGDKQYYHMGAGHTDATQDIRNKAVSDDLDFEEVLKDAHHGYKTLFFNKDQMAILTTDNFPSALFIADFGAGN